MKQCDKLAKLMTIPSNYRQLKPNETIRKGDLYRQAWDKSIHPVNNSIGRTVGDYPSGSYTFWRRRHTKQVATSAPVTKRQTKTDEPKKTVTVVSFSYPGSQSHVPRLRTVQLISLDDKYLVGLEITGDHPGEYKFQFKRYSRWKIRGISLVHFGPPLQ
jgi:hypothetical protein